MRWPPLLAACAVAQSTVALSFLQDPTPNTQHIKHTSGRTRGQRIGQTAPSPQTPQEPARIIPLRPQKDSAESTRKLTGKFLHITDIHPDPYYKVHSSTDEDHTCHAGKGPSGYYGAETSGCDSPLSLVNATFDWLKENMRDEIDFIIWTGDSARHDNDESVPRSRTQVSQQNELVVQKFLHAFGKPENWDDDDPTNDFVVPIVPTLGNNDILPHNIMAKGPNYWSKKYLDIWRSFIPEAERHQFQRGGWFQSEVIPNKLTVFSLNTMYFFSSNSAVDGCAVKGEPGYQQFEWLRIQLDQIRAKGMKAILMGHVPPARVESKISWEETCWQKYTLWTHQYRDIVVAGLYGHMNIDHFMLQDFAYVKKHVRHGFEYGDEDTAIQTVGRGDFTVRSAQDYLQDLRGAFATIPNLDEQNGKIKAVSKKPHKGGKHDSDLPEIGGRYGERYALTFVSPSVVPNYFPTIRVFSYNISGLAAKTTVGSTTDAPSFQYDEHLQTPLGAAEYHEDDESVMDDDMEGHEDDAKIPGLPLGDTIVVKPKKHKHKGPKRIKFHVPSGPTKSTPPGPAYSPQSLSILSYRQYYANLTWLNNDFTHDGEAKHNVGATKWKPGKHEGKHPKHDKPHPRNFTFEVEYDTADDKVYKLPDLTVRSMLDLAARIAGKVGKNDLPDDQAQDDDEVQADNGGKKKKKKRKHKKKKHHKKKQQNKAWLTFASRAFVGTVDAEDIEEIYG